MTTPEITKQTIFAKVHKVDPGIYEPRLDKPYALMYLDYKGTRSYGNNARYAGDFASLDEARAAAAERGWLLVKTWKEAKALTADLQEADRAARRAVEEARKGKREVKVQRADGTVFLAYIEPELADSLVTGWSAIMDNNRVIPS